jgi:hypothetical protein
MKNLLIPSFAIGALLALGAADAPASTLTVTTTADSGAGSLRQAILDANSDTSTNDVVIEFNIPGTGVQTIAPLSVLPTITRSLTIDGYTQPGSSPNTLADADNAVLLIELNGASAGYSWAIAIATSNVVVRGLDINTWLHDAIFIIGPQGASDCVIEGNFIGVDPSGTVAKPTGWPSQGAVEISASPRNVVGGTSPAARNLISGNAHAGVAVQGAASVNTIVQGNLFGTDASGLNLIPNAEDCLDFASSFNLVGGTTPGARNVFCGGGGVSIDSSNNLVQGNYFGIAADGITRPPGQGIAMTVYGNKNTIGGDTQGAGNVFSMGVAGLQVLGSNNIVQGNLMGTDASGTVAAGNSRWGLLLYGANNLIGGLTTGAANLISGNDLGIDFNNGAVGNVVEGNLIGTDKTGTQALPNYNGISIDNGFSNVIGGVVTGARNVISGNSGAGMGIVSSLSSNNIVQGNYIGLSVNGTTPLPNSGFGVRLLGCNGNLIGGTAPGAGNWIAYNVGFGLSEIFYFGSAFGNSFLGNQIFANTTAGIDLNEDGVTPNDVGDADDGPNHLQNFPEMSSVKLAGRNLKVDYKVDSSAANSAYPLTVEFFIGDAADQGRTFIARTTYTTPQTVDSITIKPAVLPAIGDHIVATATDANGNTSEFSAPVAVARNGNGQGNN